MEMNPKKSHHHFYLPWYAGDEHADNWFTYIHRNLHHLEGEDTPFSNSSWRTNNEDANLHDEVLDALYSSNEVDASRISVLVIHGTVQLTGSVSTPDEKYHAEKIVRDLRDVWNVSNLLVIQGANEGFHS